MVENYSEEDISRAIQTQETVIVGGQYGYLRPGNAPANQVLFYDYEKRYDYYVPKSRVGTQKSTEQQIQPNYQDASGVQYYISPTGEKIPTNASLMGKEDLEKAGYIPVASSQEGGIIYSKIDKTELVKSASTGLPKGTYQSPTGEIKKELSQSRYLYEEKRIKDIEERELARGGYQYKSLGQFTTEEATGLLLGFGIGKAALNFRTPSVFKFTPPTKKPTFEIELVKNPKLRITEEKVFGNVESIGKQSIGRTIKDVKVVKESDDILSITELRKFGKIKTEKEGEQLINLNPNRQRQGTNVLGKTQEREFLGEIIKEKVDTPPKISKYVSVKKKINIQETVQSSPTLIGQKRIEEIEYFPQPGKNEGVLIRPQKPANIKKTPLEKTFGDNKEIKFNTPKEGDIPSSSGQILLKQQPQKQDIFFITRIKSLNKVSAKPSTYKFYDKRYESGYGFGGIKTYQKPNTYLLQSDTQPRKSVSKISNFKILSSDQPTSFKNKFEEKNRLRQNFINIQAQKTTPTLKQETYTDITPNTKTITKTNIQPTPRIVPPVPIYITKPKIKPEEPIFENKRVFTLKEPSGSQERISSFRSPLKSITLGKNLTSDAISRGISYKLFGKATAPPSTKKEFSKYNPLKFTKTLELRRFVKK